MTRKKSSPRKWKTEIIVAVIAVAGTLGGAIIANFDKWVPKSSTNNSVLSSVNSFSSAPPTTANQHQALNLEKSHNPEGIVDMPPLEMDHSAKELVNILNLRAERLLKNMEKEKRQALASISAGHGEARDRESKAKFLQDLEATRKLFIELHSKHIEAIRAGQLTTAHEILREIYHLLSIREGIIFDAAHRDPDAEYLLRFAGFEVYAKSYPGHRPEYLATVPQQYIAAIWAPADKIEFDSGIWDKVEEQLEKLK